MYIKKKSVYSNHALERARQRNININRDLKIENVLKMPIYKKDRPREVKHATCSSNKARKILNYKTKTNLKEGILRTYDYIKKRGVREFDYRLEIEIDNNLTPDTWKKKEI